MDSMWVLARAEWPPHCHVKAFPVVEIIKVKNIGKRFSRLLIKRKGLPPSEEGLPYLLWPSKHVDIVSTLATLLKKSSKSMLFRQQEVAPFHHPGSEPDRVIESHRKPGRESERLFLLLSLALSGFFSGPLWLSLDYSLDLSGSFWIYLWLSLSGPLWLSFSLAPSGAGIDVTFLLQICKTMGGGQVFFLPY